MSLNIEKLENVNHQDKRIIARCPADYDGVDYVLTTVKYCILVSIHRMHIYA